MKKVLTVFFVILLCFTLMVSVFAGNSAYVIDEAELLSASEEKRLSEKASDLSFAAGIGVYIVTTENYTKYASDIHEASVTLYESHDLGIGNGKNGIMLLLSMNDRDYYLLSHGEDANYAFNDAAKDFLANGFLEEFRNDDWYDGFDDYLIKSSYAIEVAEEGTPLGTEEDAMEVNVIGIFISFILALIVSFFICHALKKKMLSVAEQQRAASYIAKNGVDITTREDRYIRTTVSRTRIVRNNNNSRSGGSSRSSGGGYSGRGGKF